MKVAVGPRPPRLVAKNMVPNYVWNFYVWNFKALAKPGKTVTLFVKHLKLACQASFKCFMFYRLAHCETLLDTRQTFCACVQQNLFLNFFQKHGASNTACLCLSSNVLWRGQTFIHCYCLINKFQMFEKQRANIVCQTFEIWFTSNVWPFGQFGHIEKHCLTSEIRLAT